MYKAGVIQPSYERNAAGQAIASSEPGRGLDLYIDYRVGSDNIIINSDVLDPRRITRADLLAKASAFASAQGPSARFAVLRLWSAPHFYPLMLGWNRRPTCSFLDSVGRVWDWKFIPRDMPYSEWSIHHQARLRIAPYKRLFGEKVICKSDLYLIMGKDEAELKQITTGVAFAVQTEPWRLEIDWWKSFVNIDIDFLQGLHEWWLT